MEISKGDLVESLAGHDQGRLVLCRGRATEPTPPWPTESAENSIIPNGKS